MTTIRWQQLVLHRIFTESDVMRKMCFHPLRKTWCFPKRSNDPKPTLPSHRSWKPHCFQSRVPRMNCRSDSESKPKTLGKKLLEHTARGCFSKKCKEMSNPGLYDFKTSIAKLAMLNIITKQDNKMTSQSKQAVFLQFQHRLLPHQCEQTPGHTTPGFPITGVGSLASVWTPKCF